MHTCKHCGTPFNPVHSQETDFCCHGCAAVFRLIHDEGFDQYYALKEDRIDPIKPSTLEVRDFGWLDDLQSSTEASDETGIHKVTLDLLGISCMGCVWLVEKLFLRMSGAVRAEVNAQYGQVRLSWKSDALQLSDYAQQLQKFGYLLAPAGKRVHTEAHRLTGRIAVCGAFAMNAMIFTLPTYLGMEADFSLAPLFELLTLLFATLSLVTGGSYFMVRAWQGLRHGLLHIDLPIALGVLGAYAGSVYGWLSGLADFLYFDFVAIFIFLMLVGRWAQELAVERNRNKVVRQNLKPETVRLLRHPDSEKTETDLVTEAIIPGVEYELNAGQSVPVTSEMLDPVAPFSLEWINGEAEVRNWRAGREVPSGAIALSASPVRLRARENWSDSLLSRLLQNSELANRNPILEAVLKIYLSAVLVIACLGSTAWWLSTGDFHSGLQVALSILVVSCPCALGVAYPLTNELTISRLRRMGVFVREETIFGRLQKIKTIIFDKTGTLTLELPELANPEVLVSLEPEQRVLLWHLTEKSLHPVSRSLRMALRMFPECLESQQEILIREIPGLGLTAFCEGTNWSLGKPGWRGQSEFSSPHGWHSDCEFSCNGAVLAAFQFTEAVREDARTEIDYLKNHFRIWILSGDRREKVKAMTQRLGLPEESGLAGQSPDEKARWVQQCGQNDTLFIGDGANDSLAFDKAFVRGTPVMDRGLLESKADFIFMGRGLQGIRQLLHSSHIRAHILRNVMVFAISYNLIAIAFCLAAKMNPLLAAILMPLSSLASLLIVARGSRRFVAR